MLHVCTDALWNQQNVLVFGLFPSSDTEDFKNFEKIAVANAATADFAATTEQAILEM